MAGPRIYIGRIDLMHNFSFFEVPEEFAEEVMEVLNGYEYRHRILNVEVAEAKAGGNVRKPVVERRVSDDGRENRRKAKRRDDIADVIVTKAERREKKIQKHSASRAPEVGPTVSSKGRKGNRQDYDEIDEYTGGDWREFFREPQYVTEEQFRKSKKKKR